MTAYPPHGPPPPSAPSRWRWPLVAAGALVVVHAAAFLLPGSAGAVRSFVLAGLAWPGVLVCLAWPDAQPVVRTTGAVLAVSLPVGLVLGVVELGVSG